MMANPDLRTVQASRGWLKAYRRSLATAQAPETRQAVGAEVLIIDAAAARADCAGFRRCRTLAAPAPAPYQLTDDPIRRAWLEAILAD